VRTLCGPDEEPVRTGQGPCANRAGTLCEPGGDPVRTRRGPCAASLRQPVIVNKDIIDSKSRNVVCYSMKGALTRFAPEMEDQVSLEKNETAAKKKAGQPSSADLIVNQTKVRRRVTRAFKASGGWLLPPALLVMFRTVIWLLQDLVAPREVNLGAFPTVTRVRVAKRKDDSRIYLYPTDWDDPDGIEIKGGTNQPKVNLYDFLTDAQMLMEPTKAERFQVTMAGDDSPVGPALVFDRHQPLEQKSYHKSESKRKKSS
jgi:hypothetical protein